MAKNMHYSCGLEQITFLMSQFRLTNLVLLGDLIQLIKNADMFGVMFCVCREFPNGKKHALFLRT